MNYYREKDAQAYALEIKQLEQQRAELQQRKQEAANDYAIKKQQLAQSQAQWEKEYNVTYNANGGTGTISTQTVNKGSSVTLKTNTTRPAYNTTSGRFVYISGDKYSKD